MILGGVPRVMKAMILAAGLGTRLRPLTDKNPKALVPVVNRPIIARVIDYLKSHDVTRIVVNAHHHYQQLVDFLEDETFGVDIEIRVEPEILGTGGGIKNTSGFWDEEPFIVTNSDVLTDIDLRRAHEYHRKTGGLATLILHDYKPFNQVQTDNNHFITKILPKSGPGRLAFTGIHILDPAIFHEFPREQSFSIIACYRRLIQSGKKIRAFISEGHYWYDIGTIDGYFQANKRLLNDAFTVGTGCRIDLSARLEEWGVIGDGSRIERDVELRRSILWETVTVGKGVKVTDSIVTSCREVTRDLNDQIY
jgi:mannose-1-phosphate guanylyltransferase